LNLHLARVALAAALAAAGIVSNGWFSERFGALLAQDGRGDTMPGPIIEDPPGPEAGPSYVPAPAQDNRPARPASHRSSSPTTGFRRGASCLSGGRGCLGSQISPPRADSRHANWTALGANVLGSAGALSLQRTSRSPRQHLVPAGHCQQDLRQRLSASDDIVANFNSNFTWVLRHGRTRRIELT
jgi:hypothetical protein